MVVRTRGFARDTRELTLERVRNAFETNSGVRTSQKRFIGYRTALVRGIEKWCTWEEADKVLLFSHEPRRVGGARIDNRWYSHMRETADPTPWERVEAAVLAGENPLPDDHEEFDNVDCLED